MAKQKKEKRGRGRPPKPREPIIIPEGLPAGKITEVNIKDIDVADITYEFRVAYKVTDLVKSIQEEGLQFPIILRGSKPYQLVSGFRRFRACRELGMDKIKAIIREDLTDETAFTLSWIENEVSKSLSPLDKAHAVEKLKEQDKKTDEIAKLFGLSDRQIQRYQQIAEFPAVLKKALKDGDILAKHGLLLAHALKKNPKLDLKAWIETIGEEALSAEDLKKRLAKETRKLKKKKKLIAKRKDGFRLYPFAFDPKTTDDAEKKEMAKVLKSALEILEKE